MGLLNKKNIGNIDPIIKDLYLVDPFNDYFKVIDKLYKSKEILPNGRRVYLLNKDEIENVIKVAKKDFDAPLRDLAVYSLTGFDENMLKELKTDVFRISHFEDLILKYGLFRIPYDDEKLFLKML